VNAASYAQPISPGSIVSIFGTNLASTTVSARETPLPDKLSGTSVTLNGVTARLFFASPGQINLGAPRSLQSVQVTVEVSPGLPVSVTAQGITGQVRVFWTYRYVFGGLVLAP